MADTAEEIDTMDPVLVAVITAAAVAGLEQAVRIRKIQLIQKARARSIWAQQGRAAQHSSHQRERG